MGIVSQIWNVIKSLFIPSERWSKIQQFPITTNLARSPVGNSDTLLSLFFIVNSEWSASTIIQSRYKNVSLYEIVRNHVVSLGIENPSQFIEEAITQWNSFPGIHHTFNENFDGDPHRSYLNLKRLYQQKGISNPGIYFKSNIVAISFLNRNISGHQDLHQILNNAQTSLSEAGHQYSLGSVFSFVPRTFNNDINKLSNHALGIAIDINPTTNPHIHNLGEIEVIDEVCKSVLPSGLLSESDPDVLREASLYFKKNYNKVRISQYLSWSNWINRLALRGYAINGFFDLPTPLVRELQNVGLSWGGTWQQAKDFMHFELV